MQHRSPMTFALALILLAGAGLAPAWAQSSLSLAGTWIGQGGAACGGDNAFAVEVDGTSFRMTKPGRGPGIAWLEGTHRDDRVQGKVVIDWTLFENGPIIVGPFSGWVGEDGGTLTVSFVYISPTATIGLKPTGWRRRRVQCTYARIE